jgi:hypothetical protein
MAVTGLRRWSAALLAVTVSTQAVAAPSFCMTDHEARSVALFLAPDIITAVGKTCRPLLPAGAYLSRSDEALSGRFRASSSAAWPTVKSLIARVPEAKMFADMDEPTARGMIKLAFGPKLMEKIKPGDCGMVDQLLAPLDPLPPENLAAFLIALARLGESGELNGKANVAPDKRPKKASIFCSAPVAAK